MYIPVHETVQVAGVYKHSQFIPRRYLWRNKDYRIQQITLTSDVKDGGMRKRYYSVLVPGSVHRLCFNRDTEDWQLVEVWTESGV